jgi:segregation and condensation protein B
MVKEAGKSTMPGRPNLYATTSEFLDYFGLSSISELPTILKEEEPIDEERELFTSIYKEKEENE